MTTAKLTSLRITVPELRGMLPGVETAVSTAFWVPLAEFVLHRSETFEVVCQREDTDAIRLLMPVAETIERRHEDGALMFWGAVTPAVTESCRRGARFWSRVPLVVADRPDVQRQPGVRPAGLRGAHGPVWADRG